MTYADMILQEDEYNYSVNIQFDTENDRKLQRFIPNETTIELLREYFIDITRANPQNHARILYGSYGTGKSHFLTVLYQLLEKLHVDGEAYNVFLKRIAEYDERLASDIDGYIQSTERKPFLLVPIVFDFEDFDRCIYFSLKRKLDIIGVDVHFKTFFSQASSLLEQWEKNEESQERLLNACKATNVELEELKDKLSTYDSNAESIFQSIFSKMTFGVKFVYEVTNLSETLEQASIAIQDRYAGIVFVFDEFGRYLEDNLRNVRVKAVQNLAEYCDHGGYNNHIILVSHKEISLYTQRLNKNLAGEWKKVEGRYKATPINDRPDQCLSLIKNVLTKEPNLWKAFTKKNRSQLSTLYSEVVDFRGFAIDPASAVNPFEAGFPLHPISLFGLDKLSKKVAQNERTFFTYLVGKEENGLYRFLNRTDLDAFHFVGLDEIFDYFEMNIKAVQSDESYECYRQLLASLSKNKSRLDDDSPETKILKAIATIHIIDDAESLRANKQALLNAIDLPRDVLSNSIDALCEKKIIKYSGAYDRYEFFSASIFDVEAMINDGAVSVSEEAVANILNERFVDFVLYPSDYNREYRISRLFVPVYSLVSEVGKKTSLGRIGQYYDGLLVMMLAESEDDIDVIMEYSNNLKRSIFVVNTDVEDLLNAVKRYISIMYLQSRLSDYVSEDPAFEKELQYFYDETSMAIRTYLDIWKHSFAESVVVISEGNIVDEVVCLNDLTKLASQIMKDAFPYTLIVNNELLNKNVVHGSIATAKRNVIAAMLQGETPETYFGQKVLSPEYIAIRSLLVKNGFVREIADVDQNCLFDGSYPQNEVKKVLSKYLKAAKAGTVCFGDVVDTLRKPPFGLRNGYMNLFAAFIFVPNRKSIIISSHGVEQELTVELFDEMARRPSDYSFTLANWSVEQLDYLDSIQHIFDEYIDETTLGKNRLKAIYEGMLTHYKQVSKYARTTGETVGETCKEYRSILEKSTTNYSSFLFKILVGNRSLQDTLDFVLSSKQELESAIVKLTVKLREFVVELFDMNERKSIPANLVEVYQDEWIDKKKRAFDYYTNSFLDYISTVASTSDEAEVLSGISKVITGIELSYWSDSTLSEFMSRLQLVRDAIRDYDSTARNDNETQVKIIAPDGTEKTMVIAETELSMFGQTIKNKITSTFNNYAMAITYEDKIQVLLSLLNETLGGR